MSEKKNRTVNFTLLSVDEKEHLKNRIKESLILYKNRRQQFRYRIGAVASIMIVFLIGFYNVNEKKSSIDSYVKTIENIEGDSFENVKLILSGNQDIEVSQEDPKISYSNSGQQVSIGGETINQTNLKSDKIVYNTLIVPYGRRSQIELSDGTLVWLNSGSKLVYPVVFSGDRREVYLEGEGVFEVTHNKDHAFIVKLIDQEIEVLGTVFNVSNYLDENTINTTLKSGSVQISYDGGSFFNSKEKLRISPGTMATYFKDIHQIKSEKVDVEKYFSWREGIFIFKNDKLEFIMNRLSKYYNVNIVIEDNNLSNQTFTGHLDLKDDVQRVIQTIKETTSFELSIENDEIKINKNHK